MDDYVGDVAMDEELARAQADDLVRRHAAVGAADPQVRRRLLRGQPLEKVRIALVDALRPRAVVGEQVRQMRHEPA